MKTKILILASNPEGTHPLELQKEIDILKETFKKSPNRDRFIIETNYSVSPENLQSILFDEKPNIIHFCGHGEGEGGLVIENDLRQIHLVNKKALAKSISFCEEIKCVLLNACDTDVQAEEISQHIDYVIGMRQPILDCSAIAFSRGFYDALAREKTIPEAYEWGCNQINLYSPDVSNSFSQRNASFSKEKANSKKREIPEHLIPQLYSKQNLNKIELLKESANNDDLNLPLEQRADFQRLKTYLDEGKWKEADGMTRMLILNLTNNNLLENAIDNIECEHLSTIDRLWLDSSNERFGFSIQNLIYESSGRSDVEWSKKVEWRKPDCWEIVRNTTGRSLFNWIPYDELKFNLNAPKGHLPALGKHGYGKDGTLPLLKHLSQKLSKCNIC